MSIDTAAILQTVSTIRKQMTRGLTLTIENYHTGYHLRNMEYYCETECFNAPTITIEPGSWGVGAFRSTLTCGTRGVLIYELFGGGWNFSDRLFLIVGWHVPLMGTNTHFLQVAQINSPSFPEEKSERHRILEVLFKKKVPAGKSIFLNVNPTDVTDYTPKDPKEEVPEYWLSASTSMATSTIANLKCELHPYQRPVTYAVDGPLQISGPPEKYSLTKLAEKKFAQAENAINDTLRKYGCIETEVKLKSNDDDGDITTKVTTEDGIGGVAAVEEKSKVETKK